MYKRSPSSRFQKDITRLFKKNKKLAQELFTHLQAIKNNPTGYHFMTGNLKDLYHYNFGRRPEYRIVYAVTVCCDQPDCPSDEDIAQGESCSGLIDLLFIATREECNNLYNKKRTEQLVNFSFERKKPL